MDIKIYREIMRDYDLKRQKAENDCYILKMEIFKKTPKIKTLLNEIDTLSIKNLKNSLNNDAMSRDIQNQNLENKIKDINKKISDILEKEGYDKNVFTPKYECLLCNDTGYVKDKQCSCLKQNIINKTYRQSNMLKLEEENFKTFDSGFYSNSSDPKFGIDKSPLKNIESIKDIAVNFCNNISDKNQKNLLFIGNTGLGKTFLSNCIAEDVMKKGYTAIYQTAPMLMDIVIEHKFSYGRDNSSKDEYNKIFEADLLIIDDLGTETLSNTKFTEIFNIINTRLLNNKKIIISTNLALNELYNVYDERVISRLIGNFTICKFIGEDIRLKKKKMN